MKKLFKRKKAEDSSVSSKRITNDTLAEHRERVIAGGKKFKYPLQYTRHKLVVNTIIIGIVTVVALVAVGWHQLYIAQNSSAFFHRVAKILSLPVGAVDGTPIRFHDYLLNYRASEHYLTNFDQTTSNTEDGKLQLEYKKRDAMDVAIADAYARKIAAEKNLSVTGEEVEKEAEQLRTANNAKLTKETSNASVRKILGLNEEEAEAILRNGILRGKAKFAVDVQAKQLQSSVDTLMNQHKGDFEAVKAKLTKEDQSNVVIGVSGLIGKSDVFSGLRANEIATMKKGQASPVIRSVAGTGYYYVKLLESNDTQISFAFFQIPLKQFDDNIKRLKEDGKIKEYISINIEDQKKEQ